MVHLVLLVLSSTAGSLIKPVTFIPIDSLLTVVAFYDCGSLTIYVAIHSGGSLLESVAFDFVGSLLIIDISRCMVHFKGLLLLFILIHSQLMLLSWGVVH